MPCPHSGGGINMSFSRSLFFFVIIHSFLPDATYTSLKHEFKYVHLLIVHCQSFSQKKTCNVFHNEFCFFGAFGRTETKRIFVFITYPFH